MATEPNIPGNNTADDAGDELVQFDDRQQRKINELVRKRLEKQKKSDAKKAAEFLAKAEVELRARIKAEVEAEAAATAECRDAEAKAAQTEEEVTALRSQTAVLRREKAILDAVQSVNFIDAGDARSLIEAFCTIDEEENGSFIVRENGAVVTDSEGKPLSIEDYVREWAASRPYLISGPTLGGSGSSEARSKVGLSWVRHRSQLTTVAEKVQYIARHGLDDWKRLKN